MMIHWLHKQIPFWEKYPILRMLLAYIMGIICTAEISLPTGQLLMLTITLLLLFVLFKKKSFLHIIWLPLFFLIGVVNASMTQSKLLSPITKQQVLDAEGIVGVVETAPQDRKKTVRVVLNNNSTIYQDKLKALPTKTLLYLYKRDAPPKINIGDTIIVSAKPQLMTLTGNPFEVNYPQIFLRKGAQVQVFTSYDNIAINATQQQPSVINRLRQHCLSIIDDCIPNVRAKAVLQATLLGEESLLDEDIKQAYSSTGIMHAIAISGGHLTMLFAVILVLFQPFKSRRSVILKWSIGIVLIWFYVLLAGSPVSALRAAFMFSVIALGQLLSRQHHVPNTLFLSAFVMLVIAPEWLYHIGFQMSCLAVLSIVCFYRSIEKIFHFKYELVQSVWRVIAMSLAAEIFISPLVIYYFNLFPITFILTNVIAWLAILVVMVGGFLLLLLSKIAIVAKFIGIVLSFWLKGFNEVILYFDRLTPQWFRMLKIDEYELILIYGILILCACFYFYKKHPYLMTAGVFMALLFARFIYSDWLVLKQSSVVFFNERNSATVGIYNGKTAYLFTDSLANQSNIVERANAGYRSKLMQVHPRSNNIIQAKHQRIALLWTPEVLRDTVAVDILYLGFRPQGIPPDAICSVIHPRKIVLSNLVTKGYDSIWSQYAVNNNIEVHSINRHGAYVIQ